MNLFELQSADFAARHIGPDDNETREMLNVIGVASMDELIDKTVPTGIRLQTPMITGEPVSEFEYLQQLKQAASKNKVFKNERRGSAGESSWNHP